MSAGYNIPAVHIKVRAGAQLVGDGGCFLEMPFFHSYKKI